MASVPAVTGPNDHAGANRVVREAFAQVWGREPTEDEAVLIQAVASIETGYGRWPGQHANNAAQGKINWGNIEYQRKSADEVCKPGWTPGGDHDANGNPTFVCFRYFSNDVDAAAFFIKNLTKRHWPVIAAISSGPEAVAHAMKAPPAYYEAKEEGYGAGIRSRAEVIRKALGLGGGSVGPVPPPLPSPSILPVTWNTGSPLWLLGLLGGAAAYYYIHTRGVPRWFSKLPKLPHYLKR